MWRGRAQRVGGLLAGVLADLKVSIGVPFFISQRRLLMQRPQAAPSASSLLSSSPTYAASPTLLRALSRLHTSTGDLSSLSRTSAIIEALPPPEASGRLALKAKALAKVARGEWDAAESDWRALVKEDPDDAEVCPVLRALSHHARRANILSPRRSPRRRRTTSPWYSSSRPSYPRRFRSSTPFSRRTHRWATRQKRSFSTSQHCRSSAPSRQVLPRSTCYEGS